MACRWHHVASRKWDFCTKRGYIPSRTWGRSRQLFLRILTAHDCEGKFTCHVTHRAREPSTKMNNDREDGHCYSFAWIFSVTPTFLFRNRFYLQLSPHCSKMNKKLMWEVKKISTFLSTGPGILPSCGCKAGETMVSTYSLRNLTSWLNLLNRST